MKHIHFHWTVENYCQWILKECRCGHRQTFKVRRQGGYSPLREGWPKPNE